MQVVEAGKQERLTHLANTMAAVGVDGGAWPKDRNKRVQAAAKMRDELNKFLSIEVTFTDHVTSDPVEISEIQAHNIKLLGDTRRMIDALASLQRSWSEQDLRLLFNEAIDRVKDVVAALSLECGTKDYQALGFSVVPQIEVPPPATDEDVAALFRKHG